jgi:murA: UDP-N-acetylglucosamine 1-carboxyvinyltransferase
LMALLWP